MTPAHHSTPFARHFFITCDDCGLSEGINLATVELHQKGIAHAASIMTNFPAAKHAFDLFSRYPSLEMGVHLNLTDGFALIRPSALTRHDGRLLTRSAFFRRALLPTPMFLERAEAEMRAQIGVFTQAGVAPRHLTTHLHFHTIPALRKIVLRLAGEFNIPWIRAYRLESGVIPQNPFYTTRRSDSESSEILMPDHLIGVKWWVDHHPKRLLSVIRTLQGTTEFVIHPCTPHDSTYPAGVRYLPHERHAEMQFVERIGTALLHTSYQQPL